MVTLFLKIAHPNACYKLNGRAVKRQENLRTIKHQSRYTLVKAHENANNV